MAQQLAKDTFTGTNGTAITSHTMDVGSGWTLQLGNSATIQNNQATNPVNTCWATTTSSASNIHISLDIIVLAPGGTGIIFRFTDTNNFLFTIVSSGTPNTLDIWQRVSGSNSRLATGSVVAVPFTMSLTVNGTSITLTDGTNIVTATSSTNSSTTTHGIYFSGGASGTVDNFNLFSLVLIGDGAGESCSSDQSVTTNYADKLISFPTTLAGFTCTFTEVAFDYPGAQKLQTQTGDMVATRATPFTTLYTMTGIASDGIPAVSSIRKIGMTGGFDN